MYVIILLEKQRILNIFLLCNFLKYVKILEGKLKIGKISKNLFKIF